MRITTLTYLAIIAFGLGSSAFGAVQEAYLKAFNGESFDLFGTSVAIDENTAVVGASWEDSNASSINGDASNNQLEYSGAAYVYVRKSGSWSFEAYLKPSTPVTRAYFGSEVAISGNTIAVSAPNELGGGAVYIFTRDKSGWEQEARLTFASSSNSSFGESIALDGDTLIVGAPSENSVITDSGAAIIFKRKDTGWEETAVVKASNPGRGDDFGKSVDIWASSSGSMIIVGAPRESSSTKGVNGPDCDSEAYSSGAAYIFSVSADGQYFQNAYLKASNAEGGSGRRIGDSFGTSVAIDLGIAVVGAPYEDSDGSLNDPTDNSSRDSGAVYVFQGGASTWQESQILKSGEFNGGRFGRSISMNNNKIAVGAPTNKARGSGIDGNEIDSSGFSGAVYLFEKSGKWSRSHFLRGSSPDIGDSFGRSVAVSRNLVLAGSPHENSGATTINGDETDNSALASGAAYVFDLDTQPSGPVLALREPGTTNTLRISLLDLGTFIGEGLVEKELEIANVGDAPLDLFCVTTESPATCSGTFIGSFRLYPGDTIPVILRFSPDSSGTETITYNIVSNDARSPFDFDLRVTSLFQTADSDLDGMNDAAEYLLKDLGFDWSDPQADLVTLLTDNAEIAGLCNPPATGLIQLGTPVLTRDATTGMLTLEIGCQHSEDLGTFVDMPLAAENVSVNAHGKLELQMNPTGATEFFQFQFE